MKKPKTNRRIAYEVADLMFDDLPDGAYFAAMEDAGFDIEDHLEFSEPEFNSSVVKVM